MISLPLNPKITKKEGNRAVFEIEALYPGYGITIGNSLRRVLLSSLPGAAITRAKIKNVSHEFATLPGILEDVVQIMLNLKKLRFKVFSEEPQKAVLKVKGEKEAKGSDFELSSQMELINKDVHIAALTSKNSELEIEITVEKGVGYSPREGRKKLIEGERIEVGTIPLDAIFTPVKRVSYRVENMRVGERTDYDRLFLEIETDGIIGPENAFSQAADILVNHFNLLAGTFPKEPLIPAPKEEKKERKISQKSEKKAEKKPAAKKKTTAKAAEKKIKKKK